MRYKLRIYKVTGSEKGNLDHEEFFKEKAELDQRYNELFGYENYACNPTAWQMVNGSWVRMEHY